MPLAVFTKGIKALDTAAHLQETENEAHTELHHECANSKTQDRKPPAKQPETLRKRDGEETSGIKLIEKRIFFFFFKWKTNLY